MWSVSAAQNTLQRDLALHVVASMTNKRIAGGCHGESCDRELVTYGLIDLRPFVDELLPKFWEEYVKNREIPTAIRKNALIAWLWVRTLIWRGFVTHRLDNPNLSRL